MNLQNKCVIIVKLLQIVDKFFKALLITFLNTILDIII